MTKPTMTCEQFADNLADLLERDASESTRAAMEAHALGCGDCGPLLADLRKLRVDAANLGTLEPRRDLWAGIAARIEAPVVAIGTPAPALNVERWTLNAKRRRVWLGIAAAAALVGVTATITHEMTKRALTVVAPVQNVAAKPDSTPKFQQPSNIQRPTVNAPFSVQRPTANGQRPARLAANPTQTIEKTYGDEIARLRRAVQDHRAELDSSTVAVLDKNLHIIDNAIAQCRTALVKDPNSRYLIESLNDALDTKVQLLRAATQLSPRA